MSLLVRHIARYVIQRAASNPERREKAIKAAQSVVKNVEQVAKADDRAHAAGRAFRKALNTLQSKR